MLSQSMNMRPSLAKSWTSMVPAVGAGLEAGIRTIAANTRIQGLRLRCACSPWTPVSQSMEGGTRIDGRRGRER